MPILAADSLQNVRSGLARVGKRAYDAQSFTADATLPRGACFGGVADNLGATGTITLTLPKTEVGMEITVILRAAFVVRVQPSAIGGNDLINAFGAVAGDYVFSAGFMGDSITLSCTKVGEWAVTRLSANTGWNDV